MQNRWSRQGKAMDEVYRKKRLGRNDATDFTKPTHVLALDVTLLLMLIQ